MISGALSICIITRLLCKSFNLTGTESLRVSDVDDPTSSYYGRKPISPLLDAQIDEIWMEKLAKSGKKVLGDLKKHVLKRTKTRFNWYMIFLTVFLLLLNLEFLYQNQNRQLERYCEAISFETDIKSNTTNTDLWVASSAIISILSAQDDERMVTCGSKHPGSLPLHMQGSVRIAARLKW